MEIRASLPTARIIPFGAAIVYEPPPPQFAPQFEPLRPRTSMSVEMVPRKNKSPDCPPPAVQSRCTLPGPLKPSKPKPPTALLPGCRFNTPDNTVRGPKSFV